MPYPTKEEQIAIRSNINIEDQFDFFIRMMQLEGASQAQILTMKHAFFSAFSQYQVLLINMVERKSGADAFAKNMENIDKQLVAYWIHESNRSI